MKINLNKCLAIGLGFILALSAAAAEPASADNKLPKQWDNDSKAVYELLVAQMQNADADYAGSIDTLIQYAKTQKDYQLLAKAYRTLLQVGRYAEAVDMAKLWQKNSKNNLDQFLVLALMLNNETDLAISEMNKDLDKDKDQENNRLKTYVGMLISHWYYPQALPVAQALYQRVPENPSVFMSYIKLLRWQNDIETAIKVIDKPIFNDPRNLDWLQEKSDIYRYALQLDKAEEVWLSLLKDYPDEAMFQFAYGQFLYDSYQYAKAQKVLHKIKPARELQFSVNLLQMMTAVQLGNYAQAEKVFDWQALEDEQKNRAYFNFADMLLQRKQYAQAEVLLDKIDAEDELAVATAFKIGQCRYADSVADGDAWFSETKAKYHLSDDAVVQAKANALQKVGRKKIAYQLLNDYIKVHPKDENVRYTRALVAAEMQLNNQAIEDLQWLYAVSPANTDVQNALGYTLLSRPNDLSESANLIRKSLFSNPGSPAVVDSMGWLYHKEKQYAKAMPFFRYAYGNYVDGEIIGHYIVNLLANGKKQLAKQLYQLEMRYEPNQEKITYYTQDVLDQLEN